MYILSYFLLHIWSFLFNVLCYFCIVTVLFLFCFILLLDIKENSYLVDLLSVDESTGLAIIPLIPHVQGIATFFFLFIFKFYSHLVSYLPSIR